MDPKPKKKAEETMQPRTDIVEHKLLRLCAEYLARGELRLPPMAVLAKHYDVALPTLWRAVQRLKQAGVVTARPRQGLHIRGPVPAAAAPEKPRSKRMLLHESVVDDLLRGTFPVGERLPPVKLLSARYGCAPQTLRRALLRLAETRYLQVECRGFRVPRVQAEQGASIILIACGDSNGELAAVTPRTDQHLQALENACAACGVRLSLVTWNSHDNSLRYTATRHHFLPSQPPKQLAGSIIWSLTMPPPVITSMVRTLHKHGTPVAVLDENGETGFCSLPQAPAQVKVFLLSDNRAAGVVIGRMLIDAGHRSVLFVGPVGLPCPTVQSRLAGLRSAFETAGLADGIAMADMTDMGWPLSYMQQLRAMDSQIQNMWHDMPVHLQKPADVDSLMKRAMDHCWPRCKPAIEAGCSAIVAFNDDLALVIKALALRNGIAIPDRLSLVGFDNTRHGAMAGLTSYDLNGPVVIHAMVTWVLNPRSSPAGKRKGAVIIPGNLILRESSGLALHQ